MNVAKEVQAKVKRIARGVLFTYKDLSLKKGEYFAASKTIERLIKQDIIKRISKGIFYRPKQTIFGAVQPNENQIIFPYLFKNGKRIAYITGLLLYNKMGLTTQIPRAISIASSKKRISISKGNIKAGAVKSYVEVTDENYTLLELLDALKDFKKISNLDTQSALTILSNRCDKLSKDEKKELIKIALEYPPRVRAFLGALLEYIDTNIPIQRLDDSLNPLSAYTLGIASEMLPTLKKWNIS